VAKAKGAQAEIKPGDVLGGKYRIERVIGQGGMGIVAAARHTELHQRVAIKVLPAHLTPDAEIVERFMREARAAARLRSEHAVKVVDVGARSNGSPYIVMELLDGEDLGALSERGPLPIPVAVDYILQACEAVAEAHALGILHRDLKPRNLFLTTKLHGKPLVKVLDFGLAKSMSMHERALTATATAMGSPQYMSPEQMKASRDIDFRTDIWSLGICLYELVSAHVPFDSAAVPVLCAMVLKDDPTPLPTFRPDVPPVLWAIIQKCLMKAPADRFATVSELAAALEPFAPPEAQGAGLRIAAVLNAVPTGSGHPGTLGTGPEHDREHTRIAAAFDSKPDATSGASTALWWAIAASLFVVLAVVGGILTVRALRGPVAREPALYEPDVASLGGASRRAKASDVAEPIQSAHTVVSAVSPVPAVSTFTAPTTPTTKIRPPGPAVKPKPSADPASTF
jgi:serine/threonine-protein kinase